MKNAMIILALLLIMCGHSAAGEAGMKFTEKPWSEIKAKAAAEKKPIFLDAYASWCGPCKWLAANVFTNDTVADFYNQNFINAHFDMEKGEGLELAKLYGVRVYPTLLYIDSNGEVLHRAAGSMPPAQFIELGQTALNPEKNLRALTERFSKGGNDAGFVYSYFATLNELYVDYTNSIDLYFKNIPPDKMASADNWAIIRDFVSTETSIPFQALINNKAIFAKALTIDTVTSKIKAVYTDMLLQAVRSRKFNKASFDSLRTSIMSKGFINADDIHLTVDFSYAEKTRDWNTWAEIAEKKAAKSTDPEELNHMAWTAFEKIDDKAVLNSALAWSRKSIDINEVSGLVDTYANLLYKLGRKAEAIRMEEKALELAGKEGTPTEDILKTIEEFKK